MDDKLHFLKFGTAWIDIEICSEPNVVLTMKGYAPVLLVKTLKNGLDYYIYISARSLSEKLEELRKINDNKFTGLRISIRKESEDRFAKYDIKVQNEYRII